MLGSIDEAFAASHLSRPVRIGMMGDNGLSVSTGGHLLGNLLKEIGRAQMLLDLARLEWSLRFHQRTNGR